MRIRWNSGSMNLFKSEDEMRTPGLSFEAADNAQKIADRCNVEFEFGRTKLPRF